MWMHGLLLLLSDKELAVMVSDSISMAVLLMVDTVRPLGSNFLELMEKNGSLKRNHLPIFFIVERRLFSKMTVTGIKRQGQAAPNCQIARIFAAAF